MLFSDQWKVYSVFKIEAGHRVRSVYLPGQENYTPIRNKLQLLFYTNRVLQANVRNGGENMNAEKIKSFVESINLIVEEFNKDSFTIEEAMMITRILRVYSQKCADEINEKTNRFGFQVVSLPDDTKTCDVLSDFWN